MENLYPASPANVPADLTRLTTQYKKQAWLAVAGLALFIVVYFLLAGWFAWTAYRLISGAIEGEGSLISWLVGAAAAFLAVFMLKALVFVKRGSAGDDVEVTAASEPKLFEFLFRLADEAGAPRPHRVYLSPRVNAAVFYDLSILNLFFPSKKNLEIGLGLVNVLSLSEFKAVLAHEFGHFAQKSMAVGSWVYVGQQIAAHIVAKRDVLDKFLLGLSGFDLRIAWIGWILRAIVWSIRSLVEAVFSVVVIAQRALSRQMEMQADLVAVSLTGSDALISALHRMQAADEAWHRAVDFLNTELGQGVQTKDVFALQRRALQRMATVLNDPSYGASPTLPLSNADKFRVFKAQIAQPPAMWLSHPQNHEREENAKRTYIKAASDDRPAWVVFADDKATCAAVTAGMIGSVGRTDLKPRDVEESLKQLDQEFDREFYNPAYRGAYLGRSVVRGAATAADLYREGSHTVEATLAALYPETLTEQLEKLRNLRQEKVLLEQLRDGHLQAPEGIIRHRGRELARPELPAAIAALKVEATQAEFALWDHDKRCRSAHRNAATGLKNGWEDYLLSCGKLLHYADHTEANLLDLHRYLQETVRLAVLSGTASKAQIAHILSAAGVLHTALTQVYAQAPQVQLDAAVSAQLGVDTWKDALQEFTLPSATSEHINDWLRICNDWMRVTMEALAKLKLAALDKLLTVEATIAKMATLAVPVSPAPPAPSPMLVPNDYPTLVPGQERQMREKLGLLSRVQNATGALPTAGKTIVAVAMLGTVLGFGATVGQATVTVYNGLARPVVVTINGAASQTISAASSDDIEVPGKKKLSITAKTVEGAIIESFETETVNRFSHQIYNVASASPLTEWTAFYGNGARVPDRQLGAPRWSATTATTLFHAPPTSVRSKSGGSTVLVLKGYAGEAPETMLSRVADKTQRDALIAAHAKWDPEGSENMVTWLSAAAQTPVAAAILTHRLAANPLEIAALRLEQNAQMPSSAALEAVCVRHRNLADKNSENLGLQYIKARCTIGEEAQRDALIAQYRATQNRPNNAWSAFAAGYGFMQLAQWEDARSAFEAVKKTDRPLAKLSAVYLARVRRVLGDGAKLADLLPISGGLAAHDAIERGALEKGDSALAFFELNNGKLDKALTISRTDASLKPQILRLVAASDGAPPEAITAAFALKTEAGITVSNIFVTLALATREKTQTTAYLDATKKAAVAFQSEQFAMLMRVYEELSTLNPSVAAADGVEQKVEKLLRGADADTRGQAYAMGAVLLGKNAPPTWRVQAKALLFADERPYFN